jgi:hypothetical protein
MSTYSPILRTELIGDGQQPGAWGATTNSNFQYIFEAAIAGFVSVTVSPSSNNQVLTYTNGPSSNASLDQTVYGILKLNTGTLSANFNIFAPPVSKTYIVWNNTSYSATFYNSTVIGNTTAAGAGISIPAGSTSFIWTDGTNFYNVLTGSSGTLNVSGNLTVSGTTTLATPLAITSGGTGTTTGATKITNSGGWSVTPTGTKLYFNYNGTNVASLDSSGNFITLGSETAGGTP